MAVNTISLSSVKNYTDDLTKDKFDSLNFVSFDGGELATVSGDSIYNIILGDNDTAGSLTYRISAAENDILELNNKLGDGFSDTSTVTQQFSTAKERITVAEETAQVAASTLDNFLTVADGKDFLFLLDDLNIAVGRLDKLTSGNNMFSDNIHIIKWNIPMPELTNGYYMFNCCRGITDFNSYMPKLTNGEYMFNSCYALKNFKCDMPLVNKGAYMFNECVNLINFEGDLSSLENGDRTFNSCESITTFTNNFSKLTYAYCMFSDCASLETFDAPTPLLSDARYMFIRDVSLVNYRGDLSSLKEAGYMFSSCKLNLQSVQNIADTINNLSGLTITSSEGKITIGMSADLQGNSELTEALNAIVAKGWTVTEQYNS